MRCPTCGYTLAGLPTTPDFRVRCPECGATPRVLTRREPTPAELAEMRKRQRMMRLALSILEIRIVQGVLLLVGLVISVALAGLVSAMTSLVNIPLLIGGCAFVIAIVCVLALGRFLAAVQRRRIPTNPNASAAGTTCAASSSAARVLDAPNAALNWLAGSCSRCRRVIADARPRGQGVAWGGETPRSPSRSPAGTPCAGHDDSAPAAGDRHRRAFHALKLMASRCS